LLIATERAYRYLCPMRKQNHTALSRPGLGSAKRASRAKIPIEKQLAKQAASLPRFYPAKLILDREGFLTNKQLAYLLEKSEGKILPMWLNSYLVNFLRGKIKRPKGRPRQLDAERDFLLAEHIEWFELQTAKFARMARAERPASESGLTGPRILAAEHLVAHSALLKQQGFSGRGLINLFSKFGYLKRRARS
jgi:hypothetical protein